MKTGANIDETMTPWTHGEYNGDHAWCAHLGPFNMTVKLKDGKPNKYKAVVTTTLTNGENKTKVGVYDRLSMAQMKCKDVVREQLEKLLRALEKIPEEGEEEG